MFKNRARSVLGIIGWLRAPFCKSNLEEPSLTGILEVIILSFRRWAIHSFLASPRLTQVHRDVVKYRNNALPIHNTSAANCYVG
jgi:hypothetical protein